MVRQALEKSEPGRAPCPRKDLGRPEKTQGPSGAGAEVFSGLLSSKAGAEAGVHAPCAGSVPRGTSAAATRARVESPYRHPLESSRVVLCQDRPALALWPSGSARRSSSKLQRATPARGRSGFPQRDRHRRSIGKDGSAGTEFRAPSAPRWGSRRVRSPTVSPQLAGAPARGSAPRS